MGLGKGNGRGGRRPGAGRPRKPRPVLSAGATAAITDLQVLGP
jgi:hypothetical protein